MDMNNYHTSVLLQEVLSYLSIQPNEWYIDGTLGGGGHSFEILRLGGNVLGIDVDEDALRHVTEKQESEKSELKGKLVLAQGNFQDLDLIAKEHGISSVSGILLDLGVSSYQLEQPEKGFSFAEGPLDMRMDRTLTVKAADLVNGLTEKELTELFTRLGEERFAKSLARTIVDYRKEKPIETTKELADLIMKKVPYRQEGIHPATRVFQALRIAVNDELNVVREVLPKAVTLLKSGGQIAVISFHSLEDRIVKHAFLDFEEQGLGTVITKKPVVAGEEEVLQNRRSRSAKLRVFEKK